MTPKLSIVTVNLNNDIGLQKTIDSVIKQTFKGIEFIIIDGGSTDGSIDTITKYKAYVQYWISEVDNGIYHAMNKGIRQANGEYCLFLNSGDWLADANVLQEIFNNDHHEDILYCNSYLYYLNRKIEVLSYPDELSMRYFYIGTLGHQATLIKKNLFDCFGYYNETYRIYSDFDFWLKAIVMNNCSTRHIPLVLSYYDMQGVSSIITPHSKEERQSVLSSYFPDHILADYKYWQSWEIEMPILIWYKDSILYRLLVLIYKIIKNVRNIFIFYKIRP
jgi:glycosyltransferase involved in cell wall biosynthesis